MEIVKCEQTKPRISIGTIGHTAHSRTILMAAISKVLADKYPNLNEQPTFAATDSTSRDRQRGFTFNVSEIEYQTEKRHYAQTDIRDNADYVKSMLAGTANMNGAILLVAATDGPMAQTREEVLLARQLGVPYLIVALDKSDMVEDEELLELMEMEIRELLSSQDFDGEYVPIVRVSGMRALAGEPRWVKSIEELMDAVDQNIPDSVYDLDAPFLMAIEDSFTVTGRGTFVTGRVDRGTLAINSDVEIVGLRPTQRTTVTGIEMFRRQFSVARAGANYGLLLHGINREDVERGQVIVEPGTITPHTLFRAVVYIFSPDEGGRQSPLRSDHRPQFYFRTTGVTGGITLPDGIDWVLPGDSTEIIVELTLPVALAEGDVFVIREGGRTVGSGHIIQVLKAPTEGNREENSAPQIGEEDASNPIVLRRQGIFDAVRVAVLTKGVREGVVPPAGALTMESGGRSVSPEFQFINPNSSEIHDIIRFVSPLLGGDVSSLGALSWWITKNSWLGDAPVELLGTGRDEEILHAAIQIQNDSW